LSKQAAEPSQTKIVNINFSQDLFMAMASASSSADRQPERPPPPHLLHSKFDQSKKQGESALNGNGGGQIRQLYMLSENGQALTKKSKKSSHMLAHEGNT
jgi:hypothetical protein